METLKRLNYKAKSIASAKEELEQRLSDKILLPLTGINGEKIFITSYSLLCKKAQEIEVLYEKIPMNSKNTATVLLDAHSSATIEGAATTVERVKACFDNPVSKDEKMVVNTVQGCNYSYQHRITENNIRHLWELIVCDVCDNAHLAGEKYRSGAVVVGNGEKIVHTPAPFEQLENKMNEWFAFETQSELPVLITAASLHFYLVYIHPFCDGNGRIARVLHNSFLYHNGYKKIKSVALSSAINDTVKNYYNSITGSEEIQNDCGEKWLDIAPFIDYILEIYEQSFVDAALAENTLSESEKLILSRMKKVGKNAQITVKKAMQILQKSETQARRTLNSLAAKGYLQIENSQKQYIYILS